MAEPIEKSPSYSTIIEEIMLRSQGPVAMEGLVAEILARHPTTAKNPAKFVRTKIREENGLSLVILDGQTALPIRFAFEGIRFRIRLERDFIEKGGLPSVYFSFPFTNVSLPPEEISFIDANDRPIRVEHKLIPSEVPGIFGEEISMHWFMVKEWFRAQKMYHKDHVLVTLIDRERNLFRLEREAGSQHQPDLIAQRNKTLADNFYQLLEDSRSQDLTIFSAVPLAYALLPDKSGTPPDHWMNVLVEDGRMDYRGLHIRYNDGGPSLFEDLLGEAQRKKPKFAPKLSKEAGQRVYQFKAVLSANPKIWREVEIQDKQGLPDLDTTLRIEFNHDVGDHMSGFWKLEPRQGKRNRFREVDLGSVDPFGEGDASDTRLADLDLKPGDKLKYVYDFGDWVEHVLTLEAIVDTQAKVEYPRTIAQNEPEYVYCEVCNSKGKQTVAHYICLTCSDEQGREVLVCDEHAEEHEEHYVDEILY